MIAPDPFSAFRRAIKEERIRETAADATIRAMYADAAEEIRAARSYFADRISFWEDLSAEMIEAVGRDLRADLLRNYRAEHLRLGALRAGVDHEIRLWNTRARLFRPSDRDAADQILALIELPAGRRA